MFTITTIPNNITIGRDLPPTSPAVRLDERGIQVNGARPLDLAPGESTIVEYPISERDETPIRRLRCKVTREYEPTENIATALGQQPPRLPPEAVRRVEEKLAEQKRDEFSDLARKAGDPGTTMLAAASTETPTPKPSSLAAMIERAREASES